MNKKMLSIIMPSVFAFGALTGCKGGNTPTPTKEYTVTFDTDGGSAISSQIVKSGECAARPSTNPTKDRYEFVEWYTSKEGSETFNFDGKITSDVTIYAHWNFDGKVTLEEWTAAFNKLHDPETRNYSVTKNEDDPINIKLKSAKLSNSTFEDDNGGVYWTIENGVASLNVKDEKNYSKLDEELKGYSSIDFKFDDFSFDKTDKTYKTNDKLKEVKFDENLNIANIVNKDNTYAFSNYGKVDFEIIVSNRLTPRYSGTGSADTSPIPAPSNDFKHVVCFDLSNSTFAFDSTKNITYSSKANESSQFFARPLPDRNIYILSANGSVKTLTSDVDYQYNGQEYTISVFSQTAGITNTDKIIFDITTSTTIKSKQIKDEILQLKNAQ